MGTTVNTFALKLDNRDFKTQLDETAQVTKQYSEQIANSILKQAQLGQQLSQQSSKLANLRKTGTKEQIAQQKLQIQVTKDLLNAEKQRVAGLQKAVSHQGMASKALDKNTKSKEKNTKSTENLANSTIRYLRWAGTIAGVLYAINRAWSVTLGTGIEVNKMMEDNTSGIGALLSANTQMVLSNGEVVGSYEKFKMGQVVATKTMDDLRIASIKTYATFPQLTEIFQQAIGQTLSMGDAFGGTVEEINANTIKLAQRMSNVGGAIGQPMDRIREEIRSLLSANASTDSLIATMIFGSPTEANKSVRDAKERGKNGLVDMLDAVFKPFDALENIESYTRSLLELEDAWSQLWQTASKPLFDTLKITFKELAGDINDAKDALTEFLAPTKREEFALIKEIEIASKVVDELSKKLQVASKGGFGAGNLKQVQEESGKANQKLKELTNTYLELYGEQTSFQGALETQPAFNAKLLEASTKQINKAKAKTLQITEKIAIKEKEIELYYQKIRVNDEALTNSAEQRKLLDIQSLGLKQSIGIIEKSITIDKKEIIKLQTEAEEKEQQARTKAMNDIIKQQNAKHKAIVASDKDIEAQYKKVVDSQNQGFDNWKKIQKDKHKESLRAFKAEQSLRKLSLDLIIDENERNIALAKLSHEDRIKELEYKKQFESMTEAEYKRRLELEDKLQAKILHGYSNTGQLLQNIAKQMESGFETFFDFASDGFMDFGNLAQDILNQILKDIMKMSVIKPLIGQSGIGGSGSSGLMGVLGSVASSFFAKGDSFGGSPSLSAHSNTVVSQPTPFMFATGGVPNLGIMGEAGNEAILPLTRTSGGDLGVKSVGEGRMPNIMINIENNSGQEIQQDTTSSFDGKNFIIDTVLSAVSRNTSGARDMIRSIK